MVNFNSIVNRCLVVSFIIFWLGGTFYIVGSTVEQNFAPVRVDQKITNIQYEQDKGYFCWDWYSTKVRSKSAINMGVILKDQSKPEGVILSTFNRDTLVPWQLANSVPTERVNQPLCTFIPPGFKPQQPFTLNQYIVYPGFLNLWTIRTELPTIKYYDPTYIQNYKWK